MRFVELPPDAPTLLESMRAIGYSFEAAVADILDNSLAAGATAIDILFDSIGQPYVAILDDGLGMTAKELRTAMRHGGRNPRGVGEGVDLGRFGLGMKTASLSQCRCLTVVSKKDGRTSGARWDLDTVASRGSWSLEELDESDLATVPEVSRLVTLGQGTLVVWQRLDRVVAGEASSDRAVQGKIDNARRHVELVFHRFLESGPHTVKLRINNFEVVGRDPFLRSRTGTQVLPGEAIPIGDQRIEVQAYILPHASRLTQADLDIAGGFDGLRLSQGFYVYRNRRLIIWGTWFRLARQEEMAKLARVMVDVPSTLDSLWSLDIKKSAAYPPESVRDGLKRIVARIVDSSRRVYTFRGRTVREPGIIRLWERSEGRDGAVSYSVNRESPVVEALRSSLPADRRDLLEGCLQAVERTYPVGAVYADLASDRKLADSEKPQKIEADLLEIANELLDVLGRDSAEAITLIQKLHLVEPFALHPAETERVKEMLG